MPRRNSFNPTETIVLGSDIDSTASSPKLGPSRDPDAPHKRWWHYVPPRHYHIQTVHRPAAFVVHLLVTYTLFFMIFSALIVCVARDPGPVTLDEPKNGAEEGEGLLAGGAAQDDFSGPGRWCRKCWGPKPERAHHCSICGRCVLKMGTLPRTTPCMFFHSNTGGVLAADHHCPWLGAKCIGHRTYPAFLHFLLCITLVSTYIAVVCGQVLWHAFQDPIRMDELMPLHGIFVTFYAIIFALVMGSFYAYHLYLVCTNQTTIEHLSPFLLLRHLPPLPPSRPGNGPGYAHDLSDPPLEGELSRAQRRLMREAHEAIRLYDVGWKRNFQQVFGWRKRWGWVGRVWFGGFAPGDGRSFPRNPRADELLQRLATELVKVDEEDPNRRR
ncbi:Palmitoyltransferase [Mycena chlorophos]|uniref:Palmitoyltransferase n=1 Tax=Mycena chlorophos TaxID=658473 RepID=A0A8H6VZT8_MYCCL|nr:Palmitoyltransferase [Mycena chlorophos]